MTKNFVPRGLHFLNVFIFMFGLLNSHFFSIITLWEIIHYLLQYIVCVSTIYADSSSWRSLWLKLLKTGGFCESYWIRTSLCDLLLECQMAFRAPIGLLQTSGNAHGKLIVGPSQKLTEDIIKLSRPTFRKVLEISIRSRWSEEKPKRDWDTGNRECRFCDMADGTCTHLLFECEALVQRKTTIFVYIDEDWIILKENLDANLLKLIKSSKLFNPV